MIDLKSHLKSLQPSIISLLERCSDSYYNLGEFYIFSDDEKQLIASYPNCQNVDEATDLVYDSIYYKAKEEYPDNPFFKTVGYAERGDKIPLPYQMGSMTECHMGELEPWIVNNKQYVISSKLDGTSALIVYEDGKLQQAFSRGDGKMGSDITRHIARFECVPKRIKCKDRIAIRGEVIAEKSNIPLMIEELYNECKKVYKNGRNTVAGQMNAKVCADSFVKYARFVAYQIEDWKKTEFEKFEYIKELGFLTPEYKLVNGSEITEQNMIEEVSRIKSEYDYECDGIIITINEKTKEYDGCDTGTLNPKASRKFKIGASAEYAISTVKSIEWNVSKDGYFKPRVNIEPVDLNGVTISWATGHNYQMVIENKVSVGSKVRLSRRGDVIPYIEEVIELSLEEDYNLPNKEFWEIVGTDIVLKSLYTEDKQYERYCCEMILQKLIYFCSKMKVDFAGEGNISRLFDYYLETESYLVMDIPNLITTPKEVFEELIGVNGKKFYDSLHSKLKDVNPAVFFDAVGAFGRGIGELRLNKLIDAYGTLNLDYEQVLNVDGFAEISAKQFVDNHINYESWLLFIAETPYVSLKYPDRTKKSDKYADIRVVFTGIRDAELAQIISENGGKVLSSCTKDCTLVITKDIYSTSSKIKKARDAGIKIMAYDDAKEYFV